MLFVVADLPASGVYFMSYERIVRWLTPEGKSYVEIRCREYNCLIIQPLNY